MVMSGEEKGRVSKGSPSMRRLTNEQVRDIRSGKLTGNAYARKYKVDRTTIFRVINKLTYKDVE
jgi:DNA invertase Pin-like site-specific DNA recombinase